MPGQQTENQPPSTQPDVHAHPTRYAIEQLECQSNKGKRPRKGDSSLPLAPTIVIKKSRPSRPSKKVKGKQNSNGDLDGYSDEPNSSKPQVIKDTRQYTRILAVGFHVPRGKARQWCYQVMWDDGNTVSWEPVEDVEKRFPEAVEDFEESREERRRGGPRERAEIQVRGSRIGVRFAG